MEDQQIRLGLKVQGREDVESLRQAHRVLKQEVYDLADSYEVLTSDLSTATRAMDALQQEALRLKEAEEAAARAAEQAADDLARMKQAEEAAAAAAAHAAAELVRLKEAAEAAAKAAAEAQGIYDFADTYEVLERAQTNVMVSAKATTAAIDKQAEALRRVEAEGVRVAASSDKLDVGAKRAGRSVGDLGQFALQSSRALQDFSQAGLGGALNNIELMATSAGLTGGIAAGFTGIGVAALIATPYITKAWAAIAPDQNPVPLAADMLERYEVRLKSVKKELEDLAEKQKLNWQELARYNELVKENAELERARNEAAQYRKELDSIANIKSKEESDTAEGFRKAITSVGGEKAAAQLRQAIENVARATGQEWDPKRIAEQADELLRNAMRGSKQDRNAINQFLWQGLPQDRRFAQAIADESPEAAAMKKQREAEEKALKDQGKDAASRAKFDAEIEQEQIRMDLAVAEGKAAEKKAREKRQEDNAKDEKKRGEESARKQERDRADLESGLGEDFIARAEAQRLGIESDPTLSEAGKKQARFKFGGNLQAEAYQQLLRSGKFAPDRAAELAQGAGGFVNADVQRQLDMLRAQGGPQRTGDAIMKLQDMLMKSIMSSQLTQRQLSAIEQRNRELERMQGPAGWGPQRRVQ